MDPERAQAIKEFISLPGVTRRTAGELYDAGYGSLKELSMASARELYSRGINRQLASNIASILAIWKRSGYKMEVSEAVRAYREGGDAPERPAADEGKGGGARADMGRMVPPRGQVQKMRIITDRGESVRQVCAVCKNLVVIEDGQCPYCRDHHDEIRPYMKVEVEEKGEDRRKELKRRLKDLDLLLDRSEDEDVDVAEARGYQKRAEAAWEAVRLKDCERAIKRSISLVEMGRLRHKKELEMTRRRLSGEIDDEGVVKWDLRNRGRFSLWKAWHRGLKVFIAPKSYGEGRLEPKTASERAIPALMTIGKITLAIILILLLIIFMLVVFKWLNIVNF